MQRGMLRIYLGAAPGVGKTYAMLGEAHRRKARGADVVVGVVETHGRARTRAMVGDLDVVARRTVDHRGAVLEEMDVDALLVRGPDVVCVDELAHTNAPGSRNSKRWQDVEELLAAGITVLSTVNVQHLESLNDVVERITGVRQRETVPDAVVRAADQVELVDIAPEALRRRMAHGNVYAADRVDAALSNYFRLGNLTALRELALLWLADKVDATLQDYRRDHAIERTWEARERVVVALTGGPEGDTLIRRAARIAARGGADLLGLHVVRADGLTGADPATLVRQRALLDSLGGSYHEVVGDNVPESLLGFARGENATQLVLGASRRTWLARLVTGPGIGATSVRISGDIDVHIVTHDYVGSGGRLPDLSAGLDARRRWYGAATAAAVLPLLTLLLTHLRQPIDLATDGLAFLLAVVVVSVIGGAYAGVVGAVAASLLLNFYFTPPFHRFAIAERNNVISLVAFVLVALAVSYVVELSARRTSQAARAGAESRLLGTLAGSVLRGEQVIPALLDRLRESFSLDGATLLERAPGNPRWTVTCFTGRSAAAVPEDADAYSVAGDVAIAVTGRRLTAGDRRVLAAFTAQAAVALEQQRLHHAVESVKPLAAANELRTALLQSVSHDLRSPLASATAAVDGLSSIDVPWTEEERTELVETARESLERLTRLVENLLDLSRLQAGALSVGILATRWDEIVPLALDSLGPGAGDVRIDVPADLPELCADPALLERVVANLVGNALRAAPPGRPPLVAGSAHGGRVQLRVVDNGPGVPEAEHEAIFTPFQRLGDTDTSTGVGLGLALSRGLVEAMGGTLLPEETPGGGLTMVVELPASVRAGAEVAH